MASFTTLLFNGAANNLPNFSFDSFYNHFQERISSNFTAKPYSKGVNEFIITEPKDVDTDSCLFQVSETNALTHRPNLQLDQILVISHQSQFLPEYAPLGDNSKVNLNLDSLSSNFSTNALLVNQGNSLKGQFYISNLSYQKLNFLSANPELMNLTASLQTQNQLINNLRWSYRYNILHRRTMHNSHKITESKKLLSAGYFDLSSTSSNVWFSDHYGRDLEVGVKNKSLNNTSLLRSN
jgi:hypothetical protein